MGATRQLAKFASTLKLENVPADVTAAAKLSFCDWLAVAVAGARDPENQTLFNVLEIMGGNPQSTAIGRGVKTSALYATLLNGMSSHVLDFDDSSREFRGHTSVTIFPCILAVSEWKALSGRDFLEAYIAGFETGCRVGLGATIEHYLLGWHATSTLGHFSSTAAAAKLLRLDTDRFVHAFGTAGTQAGGLQKVFGTSCKPFHAGKAGFDGLLSALLAGAGFTSIDNILEGEKCFWDMYSFGWDAEKAVEGIGEIWFLPDNIFKFHASCHFTHASINAALALKAEHGLDPGAVDRIEILVPKQVIEIAGKQKPAQALEGKFSVPYTVANALIREDTGLAAFTNDKLNDSGVAALRDKVVLIPDQSIASFESDVTIRVGEKAYRRKLNLSDSKPAFAEKRSAIQTKFRALALPLLGKDKGEELLARIEELEKEKNMADLAALLA